MNPFALAYREQQQLFIFDRTYLLGTLLKIGGLSTLIARFIVQFFWNPALAFTLTLLLLALSAYMTWSLVKNSWKDWTSIPLCLIPSILIGVSLSDNSLHYEFLTSILLVQAGLLMFKSTKNRKSLWGSLLTIILYLTSGPAAQRSSTSHGNPYAIQQQPWFAVLLLFGELESQPGHLLLHRPSITILTPPFPSFIGVDGSACWL